LTGGVRRAALSRRGDTSDGESSVIDIRLKKATLAAVERCWKAGLFKEETRARFLGYLVGLGLARYEAKILPEERGGEEEAPSISRTKPRRAAGE
jgi:hypothetical protein